MAFPALALLALLYPVLVYAGLLWFPARWVALAVAALLVLRLWLLRHRLHAAGQTLAPAMALAILCALAAAVLDGAGALKLMPVAINAACLIIFALTLWRPPSMIERFARLSEPDMDARGVRYTRQVTAVWCLFFVANGSVALYTALYASLEVWTLYNGLIAYLLMGLLFAGEYAVRRQVRKPGGPA